MQTGNDELYVSGVKDSWIPAGIVRPWLPALLPALALVTAKEESHDPMNQSFLCWYINDFFIILFY